MNNKFLANTKLFLAKTESFQAGNDSGVESYRDAVRFSSAKLHPTWNVLFDWQPMGNLMLG